MKEIHTETVIEAPPEDVWSILMDFERYPEWNPFVSRISGKPEPGEKLSVRLTPPGGMVMSLTPRVMTMVPEQEFSWLGHLLRKGIFDGEHCFEVHSDTGGDVRFVHKENFSGILASPLLMLVGKRTRRGFEAMNAALKRRAENGTH